MANEKTQSDLIQTLAAQAYRSHLLVKLLIERGHLQPGELDSRWNAEDWKNFRLDFYGAHFPGVIPPRE